MKLILKVAPRKANRSNFRWSTKASQKLNALARISSNNEVKANADKCFHHDNILAKMIKLCTNSVTHPLALIFQNSMAAGTFAAQWKRANIVPIHKKNNKQIVSNYWPVSPLPICSKIFEKLIFNELFKIFEDNNLLSKHQSGFCPGDSCIYQLLAITHDISSSFAI